MFFKSKIKYNVTKAYFLVTETNSLNLDSLFDTFLQYSDSEVVQFSLNYEEAKEIKCFSQKKVALCVEQLESLDFYDVKSRAILTVNKVFTYLNFKFSVLEFTVVNSFREDFKKEVQLFKDISSAGDLVYGYSRVLRSDYLPITENKVQKKLFGGISVTVESEEAKWLVHPEGIEQGAIKGLYPLNYLNDQAFSILQEYSGGFFDSQDSAGNILLIDQQSQKKLSNISSLEKFMHFSET